MSLVVFILAVTLVASSGAVFKPGAWYRTLAKPSWTPPDWVFPTGWTLLYVLIGIEYLAALAMFFVGRLARPVAIFMLTVFCLVLVREMLAGNTKCGCMGVVSPPPWVMLLIDGTMLAAVVACPPWRRPAAAA